ncbi:MAG: murein biosynthesis integral membrane protein MurJ [Dehalococcoidia bacterium]|nr:murein biosynthesis integral membrane protein MurJ [Dehalococcoidia bacterium]
MEGRQSVAAAAVLVAAGFLLSRLLGVVRTAVIARQFGTEPDLAAYWVAFRLPDLIFQLVAGATLASAFIPTFMQTTTHRGEDAAWRLASSVVNLVLLTTLVFAAAAFVLAPMLVPLLAPGLGSGAANERDLNRLAIDLTRLMLLSPIFFSIGGMLMGILNARRHFLLPALAPVMYNLAIIIGALALAGPFGVRGLAYGVVAGSVLHLLIQIPGLRQVRMRYRLIADWRDEGVGEVLRLMLPRAVGLAAAQANFFITTIFFASLLGEAAISALTYAWLLMMLPLALFGMAISTAVFPELADAASRDDRAGLRHLIAGNLRLILYFTIPASAGLILLSRPVIALLLQRGAFDAEDTALTQGALIFFALGLFAHASIEILSRGFYALHDTRTPMRAGLLALILNAALSAGLAPVLAERGLALALTLATVTEAGILYRVLSRRMNGLGKRRTARSLAKTLAGTLLLAEVVGVFALGLDLSRPGVGSFFWVLVAAVAGGAAFLAVTRALGSEEATALLRRLQLSPARQGRPPPDRESG